MLFTICGRAGSKGIKNKNFKDFLSCPLPFYSVSVIDLFKKTNPNIYCDVVLNTDSPDLMALFKTRLNFDVDIIERAALLGQDHTPKFVVILNCLIEMEVRKKIKYDMVVDLDITSPLRTLNDLNMLVQKKIDTKVDVVFSVTDARRNPYFKSLGHWNNKIQ